MNMRPPTACSIGDSRPGPFYLIPGLAIGYLYWNKGAASLRMSDLARPLIGSGETFASRTAGFLLDAIVVFGYFAAIMTTVGIGTPVMGEILSDVFGIENSFALKLGVIIVFCTFFTLSTSKSIARGMGVPYTALEETIARYNRSVRKHWDDDFGIPMRGLPVETPPFFYGREHFALHYSCGGIAITPRAEVLRPDGLVIAGLYAAGETTGGVHGAARVGGCGLTDAFVFGDIAGREAARRVRALTDRAKAS